MSVEASEQLCKLLPSIEFRVEENPFKLQPPPREVEGTPYEVSRTFVALFLALIVIIIDFSEFAIPATFAQPST